MLENKCNHSWYGFKFGSDRIEYVLDGDLEYIGFEREFRICRICIRREYNFIYLDQFKQTKSRWSQLGNTSDDGLINEFKKIETQLTRDIKINNITNE